MAAEVDSYKLGSVQVTVTETDHPERLNVDCNDGNYHSEFTVSRYEFRHYRRHMNQKITRAYREQYGDRET